MFCEAPTSPIKSQRVEIAPEGWDFGKRFKEELALKFAAEAERLRDLLQEERLKAFEENKAWQLGFEAQHRAGLVKQEIGLSAILEEINRLRPTLADLKTSPNGGSEVELPCYVSIMKLELQAKFDEELRELKEALNGRFTAGSHPEETSSDACKAQNAGAIARLQRQSKDTSDVLTAQMEGQAVISQNLLEVLVSVNDVKTQTARLKAEVEDQKRLLSSCNASHQELRQLVMKLQAELDEQNRQLGIFHATHGGAKDVVVQDRGLENFSELKSQMQDILQTNERFQERLQSMNLTHETLVSQIQRLSKERRVTATDWACLPFGRPNPGRLK